VENLARSVEKEEKIAVVDIISALLWNAYPKEPVQGQWYLVCPPGGFPGGSHLLAASRPDPTLPPPPGKPSASSCWPSTKRRVHVSRDAGRRCVPDNGKPLHFCQECTWRAWAHP
jgi:hypothetical protein